MWFLYWFLVTRWPPPSPTVAVVLSATMAPSSIRQLPLPTDVQPLNDLPSNSCVQPSPVWLEAWCHGVAMPIRASAVTVTHRRFMVSSRYVSWCPWAERPEIATDAEMIVCRPQSARPIPGAGAGASLQRRCASDRGRARERLAASGPLPVHPLRVRPTAAE